MEENFKFGGGPTASNVHPAVLAAMCVALVLMLVLKRRSAVVPFMLMAFLAPFGQELVFGGVHFFVLRIVIMGGLLRLLVTKLHSKEPLFVGADNSVDTLFVLWALTRAIAFILLFREGSAIVNQAGFLVDALGGYFVMRHMIQDKEDITRIAQVFGLIVGLVGVCMLNERLRGINVFGYFGSVPIDPVIRDGQIRAQGPFGHAILAGCFGGTLAPLFIWLWTKGEAKVGAAAGFLGATAMVITSASSTSIMAFLGGIGALCLWPLRRNMRLVRWSIAFVLAALAIVMKAPVWFVIAHLDLTGSSSSWHRAQLVDLLIRNFSDWWLVGTNDFSKWGYDMWDTSEQFVAEGESGGLLALILFIAIIARSFSRLGTARKQVAGDRQQEWFFWSLGAMLFAHMMAFFGISYWDQIRVSWYGLLAIVPAAIASLQAVSEKDEVIANYTPSNDVDLTRPVWNG